MGRLSAMPYGRNGTTAKPIVLMHPTAADLRNKDALPRYAANDGVVDLITVPRLLRKHRSYRRPTLSG
jgi:methyl-accepting chemotaxis protein